MRVFEVEKFVWCVCVCVCVGPVGRNAMSNKHSIHTYCILLLCVITCRNFQKESDIIIIIQYVCLLSQAFLPGTSLEPAVIPTAQASSFTLQYFPYYV